MINKSGPSFVLDAKKKNKSIELWSKLKEVNKKIIERKLKQFKECFDYM